MSDWDVGLFLGRWHPLLVHLPIGILLLASLFYALAKKNNFQQLNFILPTILFIGACSAVLSCLTGYLLGNNGGYEKTSLLTHQWLGISLALLSVCCWLSYTKLRLWIKIPLKMNTLRGLLMLLLLLLLMATGHYGGSLTHGEDYLYEGLPPALRGMVSSDTVSDKRLVLDNVQEAQLYPDIVAPILAQRCASCHGNKKQESQLRLDNPQAIQQGGKHGAILVAGKPEESELYKRLVLPMDDDRRMPPKGRKAITKEEIALVKWWVANGAPWDAKVSQLAQEQEMKTILDGFAKPKSDKVALWPEQAIAPADEQAIAAVRKRQFTVMPISGSTNYLTVSGVNVDSFRNVDLALLKPLATHIVQLKLNGLPLTDSGMMYLKSLTQLRWLDIAQTQVNDNSLAQLLAAKHLQYLNLYQTSITDKGLTYFRAIPGLRQLYLYQTKVTAEGLKLLKAARPALLVDTGGYTIERNTTDTIVYH